MVLKKIHHQPSGKYDTMAICCSMCVLEVSRKRSVSSSVKGEARAACFMHWFGQGDWKVRPGDPGTDLSSYHKGTTSSCHSEPLGERRMAGIFGTFEVQGFGVEIGGVGCGRTGGDAT